MINESNSSNVNDQLHSSEMADTENTTRNHTKAADEQDEETSEASESAAATRTANEGSQTFVATNYRDNNRMPSRANEATDRLDTGSGGISAGGVKSGSSLQ